MKLYLYLIFITTVNSYCNKCRYLFNNNKCFLFLNRRHKIIKIEDNLKYENIDINMYATIQEARNDENACGSNATFYKHYL